MLLFKRKLALKNSVFLGFWNPMLPVDEMERKNLI